MAANDKVIVTKSKINAIVDAIHNKGGASGGLTLDEMPSSIEAISGGGNTGVVVTVTTTTRNFYGQTCTLTNGTDQITTIFSNEGVAIFENVEMEGVLEAFVTYEGEVYRTTVNVMTHYNTTLNLLETYTLRIDKTKYTDPSTWGEWIDCNVTECSPGGGENEIDSFMGYYPVLLDDNGQEIVKINPNNYSEDINGNSLPSGNYNVMIAFPSRGFRIYSEGNYIYFAITNEKDKADFTYLTFKHRDIQTLYVGAYESVEYDQHQYSKSGLTPSALFGRYSSPNPINALNIIKQISDGTRSVGYAGLDFMEFTYLQICAMIKYKGKDMREQLGRGVTGNTSIHNTGLLDRSGLNSGNPNVSTESVKLFGLENLYCNRLMYVLGVTIENNILKISDLFRTDGESGDLLYESAGEVILSTGGRYAIYPIGETKYGFTPVNDSGNITQGLCCWSSLTNGYQFVFGGCAEWGNGNLYRMTDCDGLNVDTGIRLTYHSLIS